MLNFMKGDKPKMQLTNLYPALGSRKKTKRLGRGPGCHGKTSGRGENGQNSRSGGAKAPGFEGGQTPWYRRLPKFKGFKNRNKIEYTLINLDTLEKCAETEEIITSESLYAVGCIRNLKNQIKVLGTGTLTKSVTVRLNKFTKTAQDAIVKAGGKVEVI